MRHFLHEVRDFVVYYDRHMQYLVWNAPLKVLAMFCVYRQTW